MRMHVHMHVVRRILGTMKTLEHVLGRFESMFRPGFTDTWTVRWQPRHS